MSGVTIVCGGWWWMVDVHVEVLYARLVGDDFSSCVAGGGLCAVGRRLCTISINIKSYFASPLTIVRC